MSTNNSGITLIGVLIAAFILVGTIIAVVQLIARTQHTAGLALENFVATSIAREGLELLQNQRDTNWFSHTAGIVGDCAANGTPDGRDECWLERLCGEDGRNSASEHLLAIDRDPAAGVTIIHEPTPAQQQLYVGANNLMSHVPTGKPTVYQRSVLLNCAGAAATPPVVEVTSRVTWSSREQNHTAALKERLYNWYKIP